MSEKKDVAVKGDNLPADLMELANDVGTGFEDTTKDDYAIPYLSIAHGTSQAMKKGGANYIEGLQLGDIYDPISGETFDEVWLVPVDHQRFYVEWDDRQFVERHPPESNVIEQTERDDKGRDILPNGNQIINTVYLYALVLGADGDVSPVVISFARMSMKVYKRLMTKASKLKVGDKQAPLFFYKWNLGTALESSRGGDEFYNWALRGEPELLDEQTIRKAAELRKAVRAGEKGAADPQTEDDTVAEEGAASKF